MKKNSIVGNENPVFNYKKSSSDGKEGAVLFILGIFVAAFVLSIIF